MVAVERTNKNQWKKENEIMAAEVETMFYTRENHGTDWEPWWQKHWNQQHCGLPGLN